MKNKNKSGLKLLIAKSKEIKKMRAVEKGPSD